ncbi:MAG: creatininase family protein, partial [Myxococcales bacterium]|nr:creatininase family protein [Myxococcales bacterium]
MNSDRVFTFMLRQLSFVRPDFARLRADIYPVRLWTVAVFLFGVLPEMKRRGIGHLVIGNEFDSTMRERWKGLTHYSGGYDQSRFFDHAMSRFFTRKGWQIRQYSIVRPLSELLIEKLLFERYPHLLAEQVSCHAAHKEEERIRPCGRCEKCRRIQAMLTALGADPAICGYTPEMTAAALKELPNRPLKQEDDAYDHLLYMLDQKGALELPDERRRALRSCEHIGQVRFDREHSQVQDIPQGLRGPLYKIFLEHADGAVERHGRMWQPLDILDSPTIQLPFPHERSHDSHLITPPRKGDESPQSSSPAKETQAVTTPKAEKTEPSNASTLAQEEAVAAETSVQAENTEPTAPYESAGTSSYDEIPAVGAEYPASVLGALPAEGAAPLQASRENVDDGHPFPLPPRPRRDYLLRELTWPEAEQRFRETDVALLPVGAIEQHGPHLPLDVDAFDADTLARAVAARCPAPRPLVLPLIPYGVSYHHNDFGGTLSVSNETMSRMVYEIGLSAARNGITKLVIINGHGGNGPSLDFAAQMINRDARIFVAVDSGETSDVDIYEMTET